MAGLRGWLIVGGVVAILVGGLASWPDPTEGMQPAHALHALSGLGDPSAAGGTRSTAGTRWMGGPRTAGTRWNVPRTAGTRWTAGPRTTGSRLTPDTTGTRWPDGTVSTDGTRWPGREPTVDVLV